LQREKKCAKDTSHSKVCLNKSLKITIALRQKNDGQSFDSFVIMSTSNLLTYELPHISLSSFTKLIISNGYSQNSSQSPMGKGAQYSMGCFSSS